MKLQQPLFFRRFGLLLAATLLGLSVWGSAPASGQRTFATPREASQALLLAAEASDMTGLSQIFGPEAKEILNSGDAVQDQESRAKFVDRARKSMKTRIDTANADRATLFIGTDNFPFPVPLRKTSSGRWYFNTAEGKNEILARRIGANELDAIVACKAIVDAQYDYAAEDRNKNGVPEYARKLISSAGKRDGLFWAGTDTPPTEFAARVKKAYEEGYRKEGANPIPYHGYYFRILLAQGPHARGGALDYIQRGLMIGGFGVVAWPAEYRVSGVETLLVNQDRVIYEKDLGPSTNTAVDAMKAFDPDSTWRRVR